MGVRTLLHKATFYTEAFTQVFFLSTGQRLHGEAFIKTTVLSHFSELVL